MSPAKEDVLAVVHELEVVMKKHGLPFMLILGLSEKECLCFGACVNHPDNFRGLRENAERFISDMESGRHQ